MTSKVVLYIAGLVERDLVDPEQYLDQEDKDEAFSILVENCNNARAVIRQLTELLREYLSGGKEIRGFFGEYRFLSNFYMAHVEYDGITYRNNEAAFQAQKCPERAREFMDLNPLEAKHLGRRVTLRSDWEDVKDDIMFDIVMSKFSQNPELREKLIATGDARLYEKYTWGDDCWGTVNGNGENRLGHILERVRDIVRYDSTDAMDDLIYDCENAGEVIRQLINALRDTKAEGKEIRGFFGKYRFLSNFFEAPVKYEGIQYRNNEAAFQAQKCPERAAEFSDLNPSEAKRLGRHIKLRHDWEDVKDNIMFGVVKAKFSQNADLKHKLLETGNARLFEENNWGDTCWGTVNGKGENRLGLILEDVRDLLREG